jgi:hypothetical protein
LQLFLFSGSWWHPGGNKWQIDLCLDLEPKSLF